MNKPGKKKKIPGNLFLVKLEARYECEVLVRGETEATAMSAACRMLEAGSIRRVEGDITKTLTGITLKKAAREVQPQPKGT